MTDNDGCVLTARTRMPWNKGKLTGAKPPLRPKHVWAIRTRLMIQGRTRDLAIFNVAIDASCAAAMSWPSKWKTLLRMATRSTEQWLGRERRDGQSNSS
jgi:hypothetical protein